MSYPSTTLETTYIISSISLQERNNQPLFPIQKQKGKKKKNKWLTYNSLVHGHNTRVMNKTSVNPSQSTLYQLSFKQNFSSIISQTLLALTNQALPQV